MSHAQMPEHYVATKKRHEKFIKAIEALGESVRQDGPLDDKAAQLIQLAAAVAIRSEGAVHSHVRRALHAGARPEEVYHAIILVTSTVGFPNVAAALSWADDVIEAK